MFYCLHEHCKLITGAKRGALYDFKSGKVYSINNGALNLLTTCQTTPIEDFLDKTSPEYTIYADFLAKLSAKDLGEFYETIPERRPSIINETPAKLDFLWLELTSACNNKCLHCYSDSSPLPSITDKVPHSRWLELIAEAKALGATAIQLIGGEPLMYAKWRELIIKAYELNYEYIEIFTNATLIDDDCINFFKKYKVNIATTIYATNAETHDKITLNNGSFNRTMSAIRKLIDEKIPLRIASIIMKPNEQEVENILKLYDELGMTGAIPDVIRPTGRGDDQNLQPSYKKPPIKPPFYTDEQTFADAHISNSCLAEKLAITANGDIIPCIFARNQVCGNILNTPLSTILNGHKLKYCWHTTKDLITKCKDCEYRYACSDCRPLAQSLDKDKNWQASPADCSYNPYTGIWEDEKLTN